MPSDHTRTLLSFASAALLAVLAIASTESKKTSHSTANEPISNISWQTIDRIYGLRYKETELRKNEEWKRFEGKRVKWTGTVSEVSETFGSLAIHIKMNPGTFSSDIILTLKDSERSKAVQLQKGDPVTFTGTLQSWGSIMPISMDDGEIMR